MRGFDCAHRLSAQETHPVFPSPSSRSPSIIPHIKCPGSKVGSTTTALGVLLRSPSALVVATDLTQCLEDLKTNPDPVGGVDPWGHPTSPAAAVGSAYKSRTFQLGVFLSTVLRGGSSLAGSCQPVPLRFQKLCRYFTLSESSFHFVAIRIVYQNALRASSVIVSVGSPALATLSLVLTILNDRSKAGTHQVQEHDRPRESIGIPSSNLP